MIFLIKIVLLGDEQSGKKELKEKYMGKRAVPYSESIGVDFFIKDDVIDGRSIRFQIWDIPPQTRYYSVRSIYYSGAHVSVLVFDVTKRDSFENLENWIKEVWNQNGKEVIPLVILGNNSNLRNQYPDSISDEVAKEFCNKLSEQTKSKSFEVMYFPTSTATGLNVQKCFEYLVKAFLRLVEKSKKIH